MILNDLRPVHTKHDNYKDNDKGFKVSTDLKYTFKNVFLEVHVYIPIWIRDNIVVYIKLPC